MIAPAHQLISLQQLLSCKTDLECTATKCDYDASISVVSAVLESNNGNEDALCYNGDEAGSDFGNGYSPLFLDILQVSNVSKEFLRIACPTAVEFCVIYVFFKK